MFFMPVIIAKSGASFSRTEEYYTLALQQFFGIFGPIAAAWLVETRFGRRYTFCIPFVISGILSFGLYLSVGSKIVIIVISSILGFFTNCAWAAGYTLNAELYPTEIRSTAMGWGSSV